MSKTEPVLIYLRLPYAVLYEFKDDGKQDTPYRIHYYHWNFRDKENYWEYLRSGVLNENPYATRSSMEKLNVFLENELRPSPSKVRALILEEKMDIAMPE